ncbi:hypothetical protein BRD00_12975 [Halobacteriales archaeon QS_8_69_26]|nr:MAG: hypothetical protein BRD00_12975 [Halobacteriales archaeon QS_8_69_26]
MSRDIRVLHVDDDPGLVTLVANYLERERGGMTVATETDPTAVPDRVREERVDCVVSDYQMPRMDGVALLERVREEYPDLPFVLFTGRGSEGVASSAISAGVTDYIQKGGTETYELLANRIEKAVDRRRAHREVERVRAGFRQVADAADDPVFTVDGDGTVVYANESMERVVGRAPEELVGRPVSDLVEEVPATDGGPEFHAEPTDDWRSVSGRVRHADGHLVPVRASYTTIDLDDRRIYSGILRECEE